MTTPDAGMEPFLVYEDEAIIAVHKPCRLHSAPLPGGGASLSDWVFSRWPETSFEASALRGEGGAAEGGLFHRLDYETSGLVLFARSPAILSSLLEAQEEGLAAKGYRAVASRSEAAQPGARPGRGQPSGFDGPYWERFLDGLGASGGWSAGEGEPALEVECRFRPFGPRGARVACLGLADTQDGTGEGGEGKARERRGSPERVYTSSILALKPVTGSASATLPLLDPGLPPEAGTAVLEVRVLIRRGFRHQIRAQLAWLGLPLAGDGLYGGLPASRLGLMAESLEFPHPLSGAQARIVDPA